MFNFFYNIDEYIFDENDVFYKDPTNQNFLKKSLYLLYFLACVYLIICFLCFYFKIV